jgi:acetolactate synthase-1/2/3 large subunit
MEQKTMTNASDAAVSCLERLGASVAFGIPGMWSLPIYESLATSSIKHVLVRHEEYASYAADGFARASGRFGLCVGTSGPGAVNIAAGLAVPCRDHSPVLALTGQVPTEELGRGWIEDMDLASIFKPVTKSTIQLMDASSAYTAVAESYKTAMEGCPGPAHVCIPGDLQKRPSPIRDYTPILSKPDADPIMINAVLEAVVDSKAPAIIAGWGAIQSGASDCVLRLAERLSAPVATSYMGRGIIPEDHPLAVGPAGRRGTVSANKALSGCDLLISLGCRLTNMTTAGSSMKCAAIHVDIEPNNFTPLASIKVKSDISAFIDDLLPRIQPTKRSPWFSPSEEPSDSSPAKGFAKAIASFRDAIITVDIGQHTIWTMTTVKPSRPRSILFSGNLSAMGYALPAAIGAKLAEPERKVISVMGDGGFQMTSSELSTVKENGLAIAFCIFNNRTLGLIRQLQERVYGRTYGVDYSAPPDYVKLAEAHGIRAIRAEKPAEAQDALKSFDEPLVIEMPLPRDSGVPLGRPRVLD